MIISRASNKPWSSASTKTWDDRLSCSPKGDPRLAGTHGGPNGRVVRAGFPGCRPVRRAATRPRHRPPFRGFAGRRHAARGNGVAAGPSRHPAAPGTPGGYPSTHDSPNPPGGQPETARAKARHVIGQRRRGPPPRYTARTRRAVDVQAGRRRRRAPHRGREPGRPAVRIRRPRPRAPRPHRTAAGAVARATTPPGGPPRPASGARDTSARRRVDDVPRRTVHQRPSRAARRPTGSADVFGLTNTVPVAFVGGNACAVPVDRQIRTLSEQVRARRPGRPRRATGPGRRG